VGPLLAVAGSVSRNATLSDIGIHVSESYAAAAAAVYIVKGIAGRARPYWVSSLSAYDFELGRGFPHREPYSSFPSGHATGSFAFAASISVEAARRWPEHKVLIGGLAYGGAFLDGVSRVYRDTHWPSDVAAGALIGTVSGILVTRHQHAHPDNRLDAFARRVLFAPAPTADCSSASGARSRSQPGGDSSRHETRLRHRVPDRLRLEVAAHRHHDRRAEHAEHRREHQLQHRLTRLLRQLRRNRVRRRPPPADPRAPGRWRSDARSPRRHTPSEP
jgi:membrane-associated phospholipid phosphatase